MYYTIERWYKVSQIWRNLDTLTLALKLGLGCLFIFL